MTKRLPIIAVALSVAFLSCSSPPVATRNARLTSRIPPVSLRPAEELFGGVTVITDGDVITAEPEVFGPSGKLSVAARAVLAGSWRGRSINELVSILQSSEMRVDSRRWYFPNVAEATR